MKSTWKPCWITVIAIAISPTLLSEPVIAQSIPITAAPDGTGTVVLPNGARFDITGGTQSGTNLFHSLQQFGLNQGQTANFLSHPNIQNILGRVVGGDPSVINGLIQITGGNSNLYIMNPAGLIFGANSSLNVPAAFTATTANGIQVGNSWFGMNTSASELKNLTGTPNAFAFNSPTTALPQGQITGVILNQGNLSVPDGKSISLVGGIVINTGTISTPNGKINIVAVPDGKYVRITPEGNVLSLDLPIATQQELGNAKPMSVVELPSLLAGTGITAPTLSGTAIASGNFTASGINILANRYSTSQASLNATNIQQGWNFVFIDSTVKNYQTLLDGTKGGSNVTVINPDQYGIRQVTETLASVMGANSLHIVSEGDAGSFWLGKDFVSSNNIAKYSNDLQAWKTALSPAANILLYACNLADGVNGVALVQAVRNLTGHEVAASTNRTGAIALGGDWNLEYRTGRNPITTIFSNSAMQSYKDTLAIFTVLNAGDIVADPDSLRGKITAANGAAGADVIRFDLATFATPQTITLLAGSGGELVISEDLTIQGTGASNLTVSGNNISRVFNITAGNVTLDGLTIANGNVVGDGGGISNNGFGTLSVTNSTVSGNTATVNGGGIYSNNGAVNVTNSTLSGNTATNRDGGGIYSEIGDLTVIGSSVLGNTSSRQGGGVSSRRSLTITNSNISGNTANTIAGGGIYGGTGTTTITNSTVSGNTINSNQFGGGGIVIEQGGVLVLTNSTVSGNTSLKDGGGIYMYFSNGTITNSTITNNTADSGNNGGGDGGGIFNTNASTLTISNSIIAGNFDTPNNAGVGTKNPDVSGTFVDSGNNLIGDATGSPNFITSALVGTDANRLVPQLGTLANNGGITPTQALLPNSPALNSGNNAFATATDQRGAPRIVGSAIDIGAVEFQGYSLAPLVNTTPQTTNINTSFAQLLGVQVIENFVNIPIFTPNILVAFTPPSSAASGAFAGNTSVLTNNLGIAVAPVFTANGISGSYTVVATANGFTPSSFSLTNVAPPVTPPMTNKVVSGFGGVYPSREDRERHTPRLEEQEQDDLKFIQVLCLDDSLAIAQTTSIPTCKKNKLKFIAIAT